MERLLGDLLECLDKKYPQSTTIRQLVDDGFSKSLIFEAMTSDLVGRPHNWGTLSEKAKEYYLDEAQRKDTTFVVLLSNGFIMLNQIRLKKITEDLNNTIKEFDRSSRKYTKVMIWLTGIIAALTLVLLFK